MLMMENRRLIFQAGDVLILYTQKDGGYEVLKRLGCHVQTLPFHPAMSASSSRLPTNKCCGYLKMLGKLVGGGGLTASSR